MAHFDCIDLLETHKSPFPELVFVLPSLLKRTVGALIAPGGAGKSMFALQIAFEMAGGNGSINLSEFRGRAAYCGAEDPTCIVKTRFKYLAEAAKMSNEDVYLLQKNLNLYTTVDDGRQPDIFTDECLDSLKAIAETHDLLILDTMRRFHTHDENSNEEMSQLVSRMEEVAKHGDCAVIFLHHTNKMSAHNSAGDSMQASRGSSVLVYNPRWQGNLCPMTKDEAAFFGMEDNDAKYYVRFAPSKTNYGPPSDDQWLKRGPNGLLESIQLSRDRGESKKNQGKRNSVF